MKNLWHSKKNYFIQNYDSFNQNKVKSQIYDDWIGTGTFLPHQFRSNTKSMTEAEKNSAADTGFKKMKEASEHMKKNISKFQQKMEETNAYMLAKIE